VAADGTRGELTRSGPRHDEGDRLRFEGWARAERCLGEKAQPIAIWIRMKLNETILNEVLQWGEDVPDFKRSHAVDGLTIAQVYADGIQGEHGLHAEGIGNGRERSLPLLAIDLSWLIWLDDRFDSPKDPTKLVDVDALVQVAAWDNPTAPTTPEAEAFSRLRARFEPEADDDAARRLWLSATVDVFRAYHKNAAFSHGGGRWSYAEYLQNGEGSIAVMHCIAAISLLYGYDMPARVSDPGFTRMIRNLSLAMRLQNDLASAAKERVEGDSANAVLIVDEFMAPDRAADFILAQRNGYERLLAADLQALGHNDPFSRIARVMITTLELFYCVPRERYATPNEGRARARDAATTPYL
jgi:hypothetical protein